MQITVYLDVIFLINFIADFSVLFITGVILKQRIVMWRLVTGAVFGAGMLLFFILSPFLQNGRTGAVICVGISMGAVAISYGRRNGGLIRKWFLSTTIMVLIGSVMNYLRYISGETTLQLCKWMALFTGSGISVWLLLCYLKKTMDKTKGLYLIEIKHGNRITVERVYMDTGNFLKDPLFEKPVILLSEKLVKSCLAEDEIDIIERYKESGRLDYQVLLTNRLQKRDCFHEIAYESVGNPSGRLLCLLMDEIDIHGSGKILKKQPVAVGPEGLFEGKVYQGLLHQDCI